MFGYIRSLMEAAGGRMDDVVKITMFTTDMRHQPDIWKARREFFAGDFPCSTLVCVSQLFLPELLIEIEAVGFLGSSGRGAQRPVRRQPARPGAGRSRGPGIKRHHWRRLFRDRL